MEYPSDQERLRAKVAEILKKNANQVQVGEQVLVRIPPISKTVRHLAPNQFGDFNVEYICDRWYDAEKGQSRNRKVIIGKVSHEYDAMIPNDNYYTYFDIETGLPKRTETDSQPASDPEIPPKEAMKRKDPPASEEQGNPASKEQGNQQKDEQYSETITEILRGIKESQQEREERIQQAKDRELFEKLYGKNIEDASEAVRRRLSQMIDNIQRERASADGQQNGLEEKADRDDENGNSTEAEGIGDPEEGDEEEEEDIQNLYTRVSKEKERAAILMKIIESTARSIANQAKKHPEAIVNTYKARKINSVLREIKERYRNSGYEDLLELIEEPETIEQDGETTRTGMTYSDVEILLTHYSTITEHIRIKD